MSENNRQTDVMHAVRVSFSLSRATLYNGVEVEITTEALEFLNDFTAGCTVEDFKGCDVEEQIEMLKSCFSYNDQMVRSWRRSLYEIIGIANSL